MMEGPLMDIGWYRDLAIIILVVVATGMLVVISVLAISLYRRVKPILDSAKAIVQTVQEVVKPLVQIAALVQGIRQGIDGVNKIFHRKGGKDER